MAPVLGESSAARYGNYTVQAVKLTGAFGCAGLCLAKLPEARCYTWPAFERKRYAVCVKGSVVCYEIGLMLRIAPFRFRIV